MFRFETRNAENEGRRYFAGRFELCLSAIETHANKRRIFPFSRYLRASPQAGDLADVENNKSFRFVGDRTTGQWQ